MTVNNTAIVPLPGLDLLGGNFVFTLACLFFNFCMPKKDQNDITSTQTCDTISYVPDMSNSIETPIDIDFFGGIDIGIDIDFLNFERLTLELTLRF